MFFLMMFNVFPLYGLLWNVAQTLVGPHMEGSDPHMEGSGVSNP